MKERLLEKLKGNLKKKVKITMSMVVVFLISGEISLGEDVNIDTSISIEDNTITGNVDDQKDNIDNDVEYGSEEKVEDNSYEDSFKGPYLTGLTLGIKSNLTVSQSGNGVVGDISEVNSQISSNVLIKGWEYNLLGGEANVAGSYNSSPYIWISNSVTPTINDSIDRVGNGVVGDIGSNNGIVSGSLEREGYVYTSNNAILTDAQEAINHSPYIAISDNQQHRKKATIDITGNGVVGNVGENIGTIIGNYTYFEDTVDQGFLVTENLEEPTTDVGQDWRTLSIRFNETHDNSGNGIIGSLDINDGVIHGEGSYIGESLNQSNGYYQVNNAPTSTTSDVNEGDRVFSETITVVDGKPTGRVSTNDVYEYMSFQSVNQTGIEKNVTNNYLGNGVVTAETLENNGSISGSYTLDGSGTKITMESQEMESESIESNMTLGDTTIDVTINDSQGLIGDLNYIDQTKYAQYTNYAFLNSVGKGVNEVNEKLETSNSGNGVLGNIGENNGDVSGGVTSNGTTIEGGSVVIGDRIVGDLSVGDMTVTVDGDGGSLAGDSETKGEQVLLLTSISVGSLSLGAEDYALGNAVEKSGNGVLGDISKNEGNIKGNFDATSGDVVGSSVTTGKVESGTITIGQSDLIIESTAEEITSGTTDVVVSGSVSLAVSKALSTTDIDSSGNGVDGSVTTNKGSSVGSGSVDGGSVKSGDVISGDVVVAQDTRYSTPGELVILEVSKYLIGMGDYDDGGYGSRSKAISSAINTTTVTDSANGILGDVTENTGVSKGDLSVTAGKAVLGTTEAGTVTIGGTVDASRSIEETTRVASVRVVNSGNGVLGEVDTNTGLVKGDLELLDTADLTSLRVEHSGSGIVSDFTGDTKNLGVVSGSNGAFDLKSGSIGGSISNYGLASGQVIVSSGMYIESNGVASTMPTEVSTGYTNYGTEVVIDDTGSITGINVAADSSQSIDGKTYNIVNGTVTGTDSKVEATANSYENYIFNGVGSSSGALEVSGMEVEVKSSVVNGYENGLSLLDSGVVTLDDTIINGGSMAVVGDSGVNELSLVNGSTLNGDLSLGGGDDTLKIGDSSYINGNLDGGAGSDTLEITDEGEGLDIYGSVSGFKDMEVDGKVTFYENSKVEDIDNIDISGEMYVRVDPTVVDDEDRVTGHALYGSNAVVSTEWDRLGADEGDTRGGQLVFMTNGMGIGGVIALTDTASGTAVTMEDDEMTYVRTDSIIHSADMMESGDVEIAVNRDLMDVLKPEGMTPGLDGGTTDPSSPTDPSDPSDPTTSNSDGKYKKLEEIYSGLTGSGNDNIDALYPTTNIVDKSDDEAGLGLLEYLNDIFMGSPYGYVAHTSKETVDLIEDGIVDNPYRANEDKWMAYGSTFGSNKSYDTDYKSYMSKNYYGYDVKNDGVDVDTDIFGAYGLFEYGLSKDTAAGFVIAGSSADVDISNGSDFEGDSIYFGTYVKTEKNNLKGIVGMGYQYSNYDTNRVAGNDYQSESYDEELNTDTFDIYGKVSYTVDLGRGYALEPNAKLSYKYISQDGVDEGSSKNLAIETSGQDFDYLDSEAGLDLVKSFYIEKGKIDLRAGVAYNYALTGDDHDYIDAKFTGGGSDFDLLVPERDNDSIDYSLVVEGEFTSGLLLRVGGGVVDDTDGEIYYGSLGAGYKW